MAKRSTAGVYRQEVDISEVISPVGTSTGGIVIRSYKGPINRPVLVQSDKEFIDTFGSPVYVSGVSNDSDTPEYGFGSYCALQFLKESSNLYVVRDYDTGDKYASCLFDTNGSTSALTSGIAASSDTVADKINEIYPIDNYSITGKSLLIAAIGPGTDGNNVGVTVQTFVSGCDWQSSYDAYTSAISVANCPIAAQVFKIEVYTKGDTESWTTLNAAGLSSMSPEETFYGTRNTVQDYNKRNLQINSVVNGVSKYIYVNAGSADFTSTCSLSATPTAVLPLSGGAVVIGSNYGANTSSDGWSYFNNREDVDVNILICPDWAMATKKTVASIAASRKDCIAVMQSGKLSDNTSTLVITAETYGYTNPSYVALYAGFDKIYDTYNDKQVYIPKCIMGAQIMARTDNVANVWDAPAGTDRGIIGDAITQNVRFSSTSVGTLSDASINTSIYKAGIGDVMWMQRTAQLKSSALRDINVRRLLLYIENSIETSLLPFLFQLNTSSTRLRVSNIVDNFLSGIKAGNGLYDYKIVCDTTNNTSQIIDENKMAVSIYVQPSRVIYFIELKTIITRTGVSFSESAA